MLASCPSRPVRPSIYQPNLNFKSIMQFLNTVIEYLADYLSGNPRQYDTVWFFFTTIMNPVIENRN